MRTHRLFQGIDDLLDGKGPGVDAKSSLRDPQRRIGSFTIQSIAMLDAGQDLLFIDVLPGLSQLVGTTVGSNGSGGIEIETNIRIGKDHASLITAFGHDARMPSGDLPLRVHHSVSNRWNACNLGNQVVHISFPKAWIDPAAIEDDLGWRGRPVEIDLVLAECLEDRPGVTGSEPSFDREQGDAPIHRTGVQTVQIQSSRQLVGDGGLSGARGPVDGHDQVRRLI